MATYLKLTNKTNHFLKTLPPFDPSQLTIEAVRAEADVELSKSIPRPEYDIEQMSVISAHGMVKVHIYRPSGSHDTVLPAVVYIHGGGWALETKGSYSYVCAKLAGQAECAVIFVHYSLAPEARFPTAIEECYAVLNWATNPNNAGFLKIDPTCVALAGDSAGGNLAIAVALLAKQRNLENAIKYQVLFYPVTDATFNTSSYYEFSTDFCLTRKHMQFFWDQYVPDQADRDNILACPMRASKEELSGLPPALIISAEADVLRDDAENFARKLMDANVVVTTTRVLGVLHGFVANPELFCDETLFALDLAIAGLRRTFAANKQ
ncbi:esterase/lipase [Mucor ambiguus]|uniref:Esterase/lipase n=1 Tax=Mucor ambiguus TaxID=91626 RepID=A0A0C9ME50_9FUNG|nr:esterase/lipase [Mucor ambiguus]